MSSSYQEDLADANKGFDAVFNDDIELGKSILNAGNTPFHLLGLGVVTFLQAALGMEDGIMAEASKALTEAQAAAKQAYKVAQSKPSATRFPAGTEWELLQTDTILLLGVTQVLSESYMGYVQCLYSLNSAHGRFSKAFKMVFPSGLDAYPTPAASPAVSRKPSTATLSTISSQSGAGASSRNVSTPSSSKGSIFSRLTGMSSSTSLTVPSTPTVIHPEGPIEELIVYGSAFGFGLFSLVFSLLPAKIKRLVGFLGFQSDRQLALQALAVSAAGKDAHSNFAAIYINCLGTVGIPAADVTDYYIWYLLSRLTLMTYHGIKLLLAGYLADEGHLLKQVGAMLDSLEPRFPHGSLWLLNRAKLARYENNPSLAIEILQRGLGPERSVKFQQADALLMFELAWVLLAERRYQEAADAFLTMKRLNTWSHPTYTFLAAGCYLALKTDQARTKAQELFDTLPTLLQKKKVGGKDLPTEVYIMKKLDFWRRKQTRWFGPERSDMFVECIRINPAEELGVFWNTHGRIPKTTAEAHIREFLALTPPVNVASPYAVELDTSLATANSSNTNDTLNQNPIADLDTTDELNFQHLILGITHRGVGEFAAARAFLEYATRNAKSLEGKWIIPLAYFELAVLDLHEARAHELKVQSRGNDRPVDDELKSLWKKAIQSATSHVEESQANLGDTDLSSRLDARLAMIRDEIEHKSKITIH